MLVTFRSKSHADITMFGDVAIALLKLAGLSGNVPTALVAADIPEALASLEAGLAALRAERPPETNAPDEDAAEEEPPVPLARRAVPLIALLRDAHARGADVLVTKSGDSA